jgi:hypothetical protein
MDPIMEALSRLSLHLSERGRALPAAISGTVLGGAAVTLGYLSQLFLPAAGFLPVTFGGIAGGLWFISAFLVWDTMLPDRVRAAVHLRARLQLVRRRQLVLWAGLAWFATLVVIGEDGGGPLLGALNVVVLAGLWRVGTSTAAERAAIDAALTSTEDTWDDLPGGDPEKPAP